MARRYHWRLHGPSPTSVPAGRQCLVLGVVVESPAGERTVIDDEVSGTADSPYSPSVDLRAAAEEWESSPGGKALRAEAARTGSTIFFATRERYRADTAEFGHLRRVHRFTLTGE